MPCKTIQGRTKRPHDQGVSQFVHQDREEHGHDPGQNLRRAAVEGPEHHGHQPKKRVDPDRNAKQREVQIGLGSRGFAEHGATPDGAVYDSSQHKGWGWTRQVDSRRGILPRPSGAS